MIKWIS